ncbi:hypothetical protein Lal_00041315 [Lupinus albus]|uniref:Uncharacterized protein n=1 Tax=Lupinus albus TaxID=3870 RepID=A0A6A5NZW1_LUPAL|nr:hypothetical protein Lalb_Chr18g0059821 [Lupinus albus]KAF1890532.1 hypothetical protein Lal_00041315 [Lupinus albus]
MAVLHGNNGFSWPPIEAPLNMQGQREHQQHWSKTNFDSSINAVSFGFVATAILISMFLLMAIFERFIRPTSPPSRRRSRLGTHSHLAHEGKLGHPSPKMSLYGSWVSVMMPGDELPTFVAHPAPAPCCLERISWPSHQHNTLPSTSNTLPISNQV